MRSVSGLLHGLVVFACMTGVAFVAGAQDAASKTAAASAEKPSGQYKIGVVDRKKVMEGYAWVKAEYSKLEAEVKELQKPIDTLSEKITAAKETYEKEKEKLAPSERTEREAAIQSDYREYQLELKKNQDNIDSKERLLMKKAFEEIDSAVAKIGADQGYHLIVDGSSRTGAIYYSPTIDISAKVIDLLNSKS